MTASTLRLYPQLAGERSAALARDALVVVLVVLFAWLGIKVHDAVDDLEVLGSGVERSGTAIQDGFRAAGDALGGAPLVGDDLSNGLREAGAKSGGPVAQAGRDGQDRIRTLAKLLGLLTWGLPTGALLWRYLPGRIRQVQLLTAAGRALEGPGLDGTDREERRRLIAMRAAFSLPYGFLLHYTQDPLGDLTERRYERLVEAAFADAGLRYRPAEAGSTGP